MIEAPARIGPSPLLQSWKRWLLAVAVVWLLQPWSTSRQQAVPLLIRALPSKWRRRREPLAVSIMAAIASVAAFISVHALATPAEGFSVSQPEGSRGNTGVLDLIWANHCACEARLVHPQSRRHVRRHPFGRSRGQQKELT